MDRLRDMHLVIAEKKTEIVAFTRKRKKKVKYMDKVLVGDTYIEI